MTNQIEKIFYFYFENEKKCEKVNNKRSILIGY